MRIVIVGGGAIGRLFGSLLAKAKNEVTLLDIDAEVVDAMKDKGIGVVASSMGDPDMVTPVPVTAITDASLVSGCDLVMLMVKSFATRVATESVAHLINSDCPLLGVQTGLGNIEIMEQLVPRQHILAGFTFMSGTALGTSKVRYGREGKTYIGELDGQITERVQKIANVFEAGGITTQVAKRIVGRLWCKVIVYSAINPLSSILKVPNGCLTGKMESITLMKRLLDEGKAVADACGIDLVYKDLYELLFDACQRSSNNLSSMLQDILNDRMTEIDAQNGAICRYAAERGISVPTHQAMVELVKLLEKWRPGMEQF
ncbi:ketopantoate reductase family protein [Desulfopila aestuarii]|uniref:2-dehydropantoate 2-reductase n=1 Tax=Desulfopila aestuarii DSM 18488 TaxID=1121416 RepID=A0A1M7Y708_9BACT|nr:2-dehydropantoate 2-reductase [Desulfopila aestuarii]SHO48422.1 2-dehydropantoate 2-reductase [Desulfopila aestuarii DSM 18488]